MKRMLFNATHQEELRVAIVDGQKLVDLDIETAGREQRKGNIYKAVITRIEPGLEACFVNYGEDRHGFLPFKEVARTYFKEGVDVRTARIQDALHEGQELVIQVEKEERGNKGAALTTFISLAGRYLVLMPNNPRGGGVSRRIEGEERQELREAMDQLNIPQGMSIIARTAGIGRNTEELQWDLSYLMQLWLAIDGAAKENKAPILIYLESSLVIRAIRDYFSPDIGEILIDTDDIADQAAAFMSVVMPDNVQRVKRYSDDVPLFSRFQIEHQIETAYSRHVHLPSGGSIVIDHTEALVAIDVNSARSTRGADIEETATRTNLEAAEEAARQLRLRDLGGLIVIDFIDMEDSKNQRAVENRLRDALHVDRARVQMGKISRFGLMELSRQRLRPALNEGSHITCPRCNGTGVVRDAESSALNVLRLLQEEAMKENTAAVHAQVPVEVATFLLNEKRADITKIETRLKVNLILIPNKYIETPHHVIERLKHDDPRLEDIKSSFDRVEAPTTDMAWAPKEEVLRVKPEALVKGVNPEQPAPPSTQSRQQAALATPPSLFKRLFGWLFSATPESKPVIATPEARPARQSHSSNRNDRTNNPRNGRNNNNRNRRDNLTDQRSTSGQASKNEDLAQQKASSVLMANAETSPASATTTPSSTEETQPRNSRNRRGRSRTRKDENPTDQVDQTIQIDQTALLPEVPAPVLQGDDSATPLLNGETVDGTDASDSDRPRRRGRRGRRGRRTGDTVNSLVNDQVEDLNAEANSDVSAGASAGASAEMSAERHESEPITKVTNHAEPSHQAPEALAASVNKLIDSSQETIQAAGQVYTQVTTQLPLHTPSPVIIQEAVTPQSPAPTPSTAAIATITTIDHDVVIQTVNEQFANDAVATASAATQHTTSSGAERLATKSLDRDALHSVVSAVGLKWVESNPDSITTAHAAAQTAQSAPRYGREPKTTAAVSTVELKQVETQAN